MGDLVQARGRPWRVAGLTGHRDCEAVTLEEPGASPAGLRLTLLYPFDRPSLRRRPMALEIVSRRRWARRLGRLLGTATPYDGLAALVRARMQLWPYQLGPALALSRGLATRLLLADEPGLGKTVQAGLAVAELAGRGDAQRILVLAPPGVRHRWAWELTHRFALDATTIDARELDALVRAAPAGFSPWRLPGIRIASVDFVKQPEVLQGLSGVVWDALVVDEAHHAAPGTERGQAVRALARRARHVLLLTATPHAGPEGSFEALCGIGRLSPREPPILLFRRSRAGVGFRSTRRVRILPVRQTPAERRLHRLLDGYLRGLLREVPPARRAEARLLGMLLRRRALSCCHALRVSVARRRVLLDATPQALEQLGLPIGGPAEEEDDEVPTAVLATSGMASGARERAWLDAIAEAARRAEPGDSKLAALRRLLRRTPEPAIVFTEFRDTLERVRLALGSPQDAVVLHGGLSPRERQDAERCFTEGDARLLLATDAAGEGLDLHARCRRIVNLDVPWTPSRLEQRIGRVDRIGQTRTPHALLLVARGDSEAEVLGRLVARLERIRRIAGHGGPPLTSSMQQSLEDALILNRPAAVEPVLEAVRSPVPRGSGAPGEGAGGFTWVDLSDAAAAEIGRLRSVARPSSPPPEALPSRPSLLIGRRRTRRGGLSSLPPGLLIVQATRLLDASGGLVETFLTAHRLVIAGAPPHTPGGRARLARRLVLEALRLVAPSVHRQARARVAAIAPQSAARVQAALARHDLVRAVLAREQARQLQLQLFDRRPRETVDAAERTRTLLDEDVERAAARLRRAGSLRHEPPELELVAFMRGS